MKQQPTASSDHRGEVVIVFKSSPFFTESRRNRISSQIDHFYAYLKGIGFQPPSGFPLGTRPGRHWGASIGAEGEFSRQVYLGELDIDDPRNVRSAYAWYAFSILFTENRNTPAAKVYGQFLANCYADYFCQSFEGNFWRTEAKNGTIEAALMDIWKVFGKPFTDLALYQAYRNIDRFDEGRQYPKGSYSLSQEEIDAYIAERLQYGIDVVANGVGKSIEVRRVLARHGLTK